VKDEDIAGEGGKDDEMLFRRDEGERSKKVRFSEFGRDRDRRVCIQAPRARKRTVRKRMKRRQWAWCDG
jgi:hypothetical protein